ncbi:MAG: hypothetical protein Q8L78_01815 [Coxiellaceae bacterium]|nr:hypothetical protein [Coxiellaceae bacterium]
MRRDTDEVMIDDVRFTRVRENGSGLVCSFLFCLLNASVNLKVDYAYYQGDVESKAKGGCTVCLPCIFLISCGEKMYDYNRTPEKLVKVSDDLAEQQLYPDAYILVRRTEVSGCAICCCPVVGSVANSYGLFSRQVNAPVVGIVLPQSHEPAAMQ